MATKRLLRALIRKYADAWIDRDPDAILEIFTKDAKYYEGGLSKPFEGHRGIRKYWVDNVLGRERNF